MDFSSTNLDQHLLTAYLQTRYCIDEPPLCIHIGQLHPELDNFLLQNKERQWVFITAWNPGSQPLPLTKNQERQNKLIEKTGQLEKPFFYGRGEALDGKWEAEESLLVLGLSPAAGIDLGRAFRQNAIVAGSLDKPAELVIIPKKV